MASYMSLLFALAGTLIFLPSVIAFDDDEIELCEGDHGRIVCECGYTNVNLQMDYCRVKGSKDCFPCDQNVSISEMCKKYQHCLSCDHLTKTCDSCPTGRFGTYCQYLQSAFAGENSLSRMKRGTCDTPGHMDTASLHCITTEKETECDLMCIWGHKVDSKFSVQLRCDMENGAWTPHPPKECKKHVTCDLELVNGEASKHCTYNTMFSPPVCTVGCNGNVREHHCTLAGEWFPSLPECAENRGSSSFC